jgi:hypothetical protein
LAQSNPKRHHYIPCFYLGRWKNSNGEVVQASSKKHGFSFRAVSPKATGFEYELYSLKGFDPEEAQSVETEFFSKHIDDKAAKVLERIEASNNSIRNLDSGDREVWSQFLLSLLLRSPQDIATFRDWWPSEFGHILKMTAKAYAALAGAEDSWAIECELRSGLSQYGELRQFVALSRLIQDEKIVTDVSNMHWDVITLDRSVNEEFLTSDRPVIRNSNIGADQGHIALPIGPRSLFVATKEIDYLNRIKNLSGRRLVLTSNRIVVGSAEKYVYRQVSDGNQEDVVVKFIRKWFGSDREIRLLQQIVKKRREVLNGL